MQAAIVTKPQALPCSQASRMAGCPLVVHLQSASRCSCTTFELDTALSTSAGWTGCQAKSAQWRQAPARPGACCRKHWGQHRHRRHVSRCARQPNSEEGRSTVTRGAAASTD